MATKKTVSFTEGPIFTRLLAFAFPIILTGILQVTYNMADNIVVGQFSGDPDALGAVGSTSSITNLFISFLINISAGAGVVVAQFYGAKNYERVSRTAHTAMSFAVVGGVSCMLLGLVLTRPLLTWTGTQEVFYNDAVLYMTIICLGMPASSIYNFGASILRSTGDSKTSLYILSVSGLVNVLLNLVFVILCDMTVDGVALATIISQYISAAWVVIILMRRRGTSYQLILKKLRIEGSLLLRILRIGLPMAFQTMLFSISNIIITAAANTFPPTVVSAKTIAVNIEGITYTVMNSFATAAMTFTGQNYGAKKFGRINKVLLYSLIQVAVSGILVSQIEIFFGPELSSLYIDADNPDRAAIIAAVMDIFSVMLTTYFLCGILETISGVLKGIGFSFISMIASLAGLALRVGWILLVTPTERFHTIFGLFVSYTISWVFTIILLGFCCIYAWKKAGIWRGAKEEKIKEQEKIKETV